MKLKYVTSLDLAKKFDLPKSTIAHWASVGKIRPVGVIGKANVYDQRAIKVVERILADRK
jgi:DNA-binding transcriptional MerR regulator